MGRLFRIISHRHRLVLAIGLAIGVGLNLPGDWRLITRCLIAWNIGVWFYLCLMAWLMVNAHHIHVRTIAHQEHRSRMSELTIMSMAAFASLAVITMELTSLNDFPAHQRVMHYLFTGITVFGSWCLIIVLFTLHYAHLYYTACVEQPTLEFADKILTPDYWDFLYFASTIAVAAQTSDVLVKSKAMRKTVMAQSVMSFIFNVAIVGLSINIVAGLLNN